jgi:hypothetical protein
MTSRVAAIVFRLVFAALSLFAVGWQLFAVHIPKGFDVVNFFVYFTNLSNILISVVFIIGAVRLIRGRTDPSASDVAIRGAATVYIAFVGIVFNTVLADTDLGDLVPWVNLIVHTIIPIAGVLDWFIWAPKRKLPFTITFWWMIWPAVYSIFSIVRGAIIGFYPYPFYNPGAQGGYGGVALWCLVLVVAFFVLAVLVWGLGNLRQRGRIDAAKA